MNLNEKTLFGIPIFEIDIKTLTNIVDMRLKWEFVLDYDLNQDDKLARSANEDDIKMIQKTSVEQKQETNMEENVKSNVDPP